MPLRAPARVARQPTCPCTSHAWRPCLGARSPSLLPHPRTAPVLPAPASKLPPSHPAALCGAGLAAGPHWISAGGRCHARGAGRDDLAGWAAACWRRGPPVWRPGPWVPDRCHPHVRNPRPALAASRRCGAPDGCTTACASWPHPSWSRTCCCPGRCAQPGPAQPAPACRACAAALMLPPCAAPAQSLQCRRRFAGPRTTLPSHASMRCPRTSKQVIQ